MSRPPFGNTISVLGVSISWYSLLILLAFVVGIALAAREEKRLRLPKDTVVNFALWAIPLGIIGARLYYVAFNWQRFSANPLDIIRTWEGGLAIYGGVLGGILAAFIATRGKGRAPFASLLDACAPSLVLGQAIGRWGNYFNMEAYGMRIYDEAAQFFPLAVEIRLLGADGTEYWYWHMATFFYESMWCLLVFILLMAGRKRMRRRGDVMLWYLLLYGAGRTVIEGLRDDSLLLNVAAAQVRVSQILSAVVCVVVLIVFARRAAKLRKVRLADALCWFGAILGIACTFVGEFERNAYQMLFTLAQILLGGLLLLDVLFFATNSRHGLRAKGPLIWPVFAGLLCVLTLVLGIGRLGAGNAAYITLRQAVAMLHVILSGGWFYIRGNVARRRRTPGESVREEGYRYEPA